VVDCHDVHVWQLTRGAPVFSAHVVVDAAALRDGRAGAILQALQSLPREHFDVEHSTFQLEPAGHVEHDAHA
jgi:cobalt-zinc-cadmium efflux system protein